MLQEGEKPHPHWGLYQATFLLGRAGHSRYRLTDKGPLPPVFVEVNRGVGVLSVFKESVFWRMRGEGDTSQGPNISR